ERMSRNLRGGRVAHAISVAEVHGFSMTAGYREMCVIQSPWRRPLKLFGFRSSLHSIQGFDSLASIVLNEPHRSVRPYLHRSNPDDSTDDPIRRQRHLLWRHSCLPGLHAPDGAAALCAAAG